MRDVQGSVNELLGVFGVGRAINKTEVDLVRYQRIIEQVKPAVIVETGLFYGGSACWFAERVPRVIVVEIHGKFITEFTAGDFPQSPPPNLQMIHGNSICQPTIGHVYDSVGKDTPVMVVLDSDHGTETVLAEMEAYAPLVTVGSYMVVEDGILGYWEGNWFPGSPREAIEQFLAVHDEFENDEELEGLFDTTQHPAGWLKRR